MEQSVVKRLAVLTSGGDSPGMNAAVRAVVRQALDCGLEIMAIYEGYQGMIDGGDRIRPISWSDVGGILHRGGTQIGSARCAAFRTHEGRLQAARNLILQGIQGLVIIGGDGSLTGANILRQEWRALAEELVTQGEISQKQAAQIPFLSIVGIVGSIDNDMFGTDMTIGADTALHRITDAIDAISSTAASHKRAFIIEVMGRHCGYLAMMSGIATGADWVLIPENPPNVDDWEAKMCETLYSGRDGGRRDSIIIVAEGAVDRYGNPITCHDVQRILESRLGEEARVTILGHVQRGGSPSAFDRNLSTLLGVAAVNELITAEEDNPAYLIGLRGNRVTRSLLMDCVEQTHAVNEAIQSLDFGRVMQLRGQNFEEAFQILRTLVRAKPRPPTPGQRRLRFAILNAGEPAPGMNITVRAAVRIGLDKGHRMFGVRNGFQGLINGNMEELEWGSVNGWASLGGSVLGTRRKIPSGSDFYAIARNMEEQEIDGLLVIGGWAGYKGAISLYEARKNFTVFNRPIICIPASINNDLPKTELCIGADTALNNIVHAVDNIKQAAVAARRCIVVEVMGNNCGYLALMSAMACGAERAYLHEEGIRLQDLQNDLELLSVGFNSGKRLAIMIRNENANRSYDTNFICSLFDEEGGDLFEVRHSILGHLQEGGLPTPFDRIQAARFGLKSIDFLAEQTRSPNPRSVCIGLNGGEYTFTSFEDIWRTYDQEAQRPKEQWWMALRPITRVMAQPRAGFFQTA